MMALCEEQTETDVFTEDLPICRGCQISFVLSQLPDFWANDI